MRCEGQLFTLRDTADTVDSFRRRRGGMSRVVVVSGVAVATLFTFLFCFGGFIKARAARVPLITQITLNKTIYYT